MATKNDAMRAGTKYQTHPEGDKQCSLCAQFIPGKVKWTRNLGQ
jgi:hypothetical protein